MTCNKRLDFAAILTEILPLRDSGNCRNFAGSAVVVCAVRVLPVRHNET